MTTTNGKAPKAPVPAPVSAGGKSQDQPSTLLKMWEDGLLVDLHVSRFRANGRLAAKDVDADQAKADLDIVQLGKKALFEKETMEALEKAETRARESLRRFSLTFPIGRAHFVPRSAMDGLLVELRESQAQFNGAWAKFLTDYEVNRDAMVIKYPDVLAATDYPAKANLRAKMEWVPFTLAFAGADEKTQSMVDEFVKEAALTLRQEVATACQDIAQRLGADGKAFTERQANRLKQVIARFQSLNFIGDKPTAAALENLRAQLNLKTAKDVRDSPDVGAELKRVLDLTAQVALDMGTFQDTVSGYVGRVVEIDLANIERAKPEPTPAERAETAILAALAEPGAAVPTSDLMVTATNACGSVEVAEAALERLWDAATIEMMGVSKFRRPVAEAEVSAG